MTKILVMGGSRFIGKHLLQLLATNSENRIVVLNRGNVPAENYLPSGAELLMADRNDRDVMKQVLAGKDFDLVFDISVQTPDHVQILIDVLEKTPRRHIHVSTTGVYNIYGENPPVYWLPIDEDFEIGPIVETEHPYIVSKRGAEKLLFDSYHNHNYPMTIVRPTFVYGPDNYVYREAYFFDRIAHDRPILLPNAGNSVTDLVFVDDIARLLLLVATLPAEKVVGKAFNGTKGDGITQNMIVKLISKIIGKTAEVLYFDPKELMNMDWPVETFMYPYIAEGAMINSSRKIENELHFIDSVNYEEGLTAAYEWWKEHGEKRDDFELENTLITYIRATTPEEQQHAKENLLQIIAKIHTKQTAK